MFAIRHAPEEVGDVDNGGLKFPYRGHVSAVFFNGEMFARLWDHCDFDMSPLLTEDAHFPALVNAIEKLCDGNIVEVLEGSAGNAVISRGGVSRMVAKCHDQFDSTEKALKVLAAPVWL